MSGMTVTAEGAGQLARTLSDVGPAIADLGDVHRVEGQRTLDAATIPRHTGHLEDTAEVVTTDDGFTLTSAATYAGYVHARDPFFSRAIDARVAALTDAVVDHADDVLSTVRGA